MEPNDWKVLDSIGLFLGFLLCIIGFSLMILNMYKLPTSPIKFGGIAVFASGMVSFIILESGRNFEQGED